MSRLVALEPPYTRSLGTFRGQGAVLPLTRGPRLVRADHPQRAGRYWHRPKSGTVADRPWSPTPVTSWDVWCGPSFRHVVIADEVPADGKLCGTCEGRAVGAGHPAIGLEPSVPLVHEPVSSRPPPPKCPAGRLRLYGPMCSGLPINGWFPCPACGVSTKLRGAGGWANSYVKITSHEPGPDLIAPCPFHRWDQLVIVDGVVVCACSVVDRDVS